MRILCVRRKVETPFPVAVNMWVGYSHFVSIFDRHVFNFDSIEKWVVCGETEIAGRRAARG